MKKWIQIAFALAFLPWWLFVGVPSARAQLTLNGAGGGASGGAPSTVTFVTSSNCQAIASAAGCTITTTGLTHLLVIPIMVNNSSTTISSVTLNTGTATQVPSSQCTTTAAPGIIDWWYAKNTGAVTTITVTTSNGATWNTVAMEFAGASATAPLDATGTPNNNQNTTNAPGPSITSTQTNEAIVEGVEPAGTINTILGGNVFTEVGSSNGSGWAYYITAASGMAYNAQWSNTAQAFCTAGVSFK